tara:strand:+ start:1818 stop:2162 length:345 start_codon:yes stop_codon:yes gene_type:complete
MNKAGKDLSNCYVCGEKLKEVLHKRNHVRRCKSCIYHGIGEIKPVEEESNEDWSVLDDPRAEKEIQYGRVFRQPTQIISGGTNLSEIMTKRNRHDYKHGSPREGSRYTYKKEEK